MPKRTRRVLFRMFWPGALGIALLVLTVAYLTTDRAATAKEPEAIVAMTVTSAMAHPADWPQTLSATGAVEPWQEAVIGAQTAGMRLTEVLVNVGDRVRKGDVLARFDDRMLRAEESQLLASLAQADAAAAQAQANRNRALRLRDGGGISEQDALATITQAKVSSAQVALIRSQLTTKRLQLEFAQVRAPDSGVVSGRLAAVGTVANEGQELFRLILKGRLEWRAELTAEQLDRVRVGQPVELSTSGGMVTGQVRQRSPSLSPGQRLGLAYVDLPLESDVQAGLYAKGRIVLGSSSALVVPADSVVVRDGRNCVFTFVRTGPSVSVRMTEVVVGRRDGSAVEILSGIKEGERVVQQGAGFLDEGDLVQIAPKAVARVALE